MLTRILSLSKQNDFFKISQKGKVFQNELFVLKILENNFNYYRLAVVISNKISKKAVWRNRWRRQIKEAFKAIIKEKEIRKNCFVFYFLSLSFHFIFILQRHNN